jgi:hypothetical protein
MARVGDRGGGRDASGRPSEPGSRRDVALRALTLRFAQALGAGRGDLRFKTDRPEQKRQIAAVLALYTGLLIGASALFYGGGWDWALAAFQPVEVREARVRDLTAQIQEEPHFRW